MATPPTTDRGRDTFSAGSTEPSALRRLAGQVRLPHARRRRSMPRRVVLAVLAGLATIVVLLAIDGFFASRTMFRGVSSARSQLSEGSVAVATGDPRVSVPHFERAAAAADAAVGAAGRPSLSLLARLPWLGDNLGAVRAVAEAQRRTADAGVAMAEAAEILGWHDLRLPAVEAIGQVDLDALEAATPALDEVAVELGTALAQLETADTGRLLGPVAAGFEDAVETLRRRAKIALDTRDLVELLPRFLGRGAPRRYLLAVQTLGRPQGIGGEVDLVGVLTARRGAIRLSTPLAPASGAFAEATAAPDGRAAGQALLAAADAAGLEELDGVFLADSMWLADLLWTTGSVEVSDRTLPVNSDEAPTVLEREVYEGRDLTAAASRRAEVANAVVDGYLAGRPATEAFAQALARDVAEGHLVVVAERARERRVLERLGAGGLPTKAPGSLAVAWDTVVDNHAAVFVARDVSHRVSLQDDGSARFRSVISLVNDAPDGPPSALLGFPLPATVEEPAGVDPVGGWAADVLVDLPLRADRISAETSIPSETQTVTEQGRSTVTAQLAADPGDSMSLIVGYRVQDAKLGDGVFRLVIEPQPAWPTGVVRARIDAPPGTVIVEASEELEVGGVTASYVGRPTGQTALWIRFD